MNRIYLSSPDIGEAEKRYVAEAFETNWVAPLGPNVDAFEEAFCEKLGCKAAAALSAGTAALHLALILAEVGPGDDVWVSDFTFVASVNPIRYVGATPVLIDSERASWNIDAELLADALAEASKNDVLPAALIVVHLYGQSADLDPIVELCERYGVVLIEDAAESLGATYKGKSPGTFGDFGIFSFNGNKIITTSGGGMLVSNDVDKIAHARKLATQARDQAPHYQHSEVGYNYRLSNICAGIGRGQLEKLEQRVATRRSNFDQYLERLGDLPGLSFQPEAPWGVHNRWLTVVNIDPQAAGVDREVVRVALGAENIESRPVWKPMHLQPLYEDARFIGSGVSRELFETGLCLPSGSNLTDEERDRVVDAFRRAFDTGA